MDTVNRFVGLCLCDVQMCVSMRPCTVNPVWLITDRKRKQVTKCDEKSTTRGKMNRTRFIYAHTEQHIALFCAVLCGVWYTEECYSNRTKVHCVCSHQKCAHTQSIDLVVVYIRARTLAHKRPYDSISHLCEQQHRIRVVGLYRLLKVSMWPTTLTNINRSKRAWAGEREGDTIIIQWTNE